MTVSAHPLTRTVARALIGCMRAYQLIVRPLTGCSCRFHPRCSDYGIDAIRTHGSQRGLALAARRVLRCNPWGQGGYDPVPEAAPPATRTTPPNLIGNTAG